MAWLELTEAKIQNRLTAPELTALKAAAIAVGQTPSGVLAAALAAVTGEVRGYVASKNTLGATGTIPDELESAALAMVRRYLFTRLPNMKGLFDDLRQQEARDALTLMRDVAAGRFAIVPAVAPAPDAEQAGGHAVEIANQPCRDVTADNLRDL